MNVIPHSNTHIALIIPRIKFYSRFPSTLHDRNSRLVHIDGLTKNLSPRDPHPAAGRRHRLRAFLGSRQFTSSEFTASGGHLRVCQSHWFLSLYPGIIFGTRKVETGYLSSISTSSWPKQKRISRKCSQMAQIQRSYHGMSQRSMTSQSQQKLFWRVTAKFHLGRSCNMLWMW